MRKDTDNCLLLILLISGRAVRSTIFDRDRTGEAQEPESRIKRIDDQIADLRRGIEQDIRAALLNLKLTADQGPRRTARPGSLRTRAQVGSGSFPFGCD